MATSSAAATEAASTSAAPAAPTSTSATEPSTSEQPTSTTAPSSTAPSSTAAAPTTEPTTTEAPPTSTTEPPSTTEAPATTSAPAPTTAISTKTASSGKPSTTQLYTSIVTESRTNEAGSATQVIVTVTATDSTNPTQSGGSGAGAAGKSSSTVAGLNASATGSSSSGDNKGLSTGGKTAVAVVVPVVVVAFLVAAGIFLWRKRKQKQLAAEDRRKEVEEYGFNPNNDPTLPAVGGFAASEMAEDHSGYRGWGNTTNPSNRKASTTISGGLTGFSDNGSNQGGYHSPGSPTHATGQSDSGDPLMMRRETMDSEGIGALGAAPVAVNRQSDIHRGPSNASSSYSAANRSDSSDNIPMQPDVQTQYYDSGYPYQAYNPNGYDGQPVVQNVGARRNTRIENPSQYPPAGNSGIAQNF
ncbi:uncharacterized protein K452DRAFT_19310 [Aplosporella prunicola CBS 121167]|uniref:Mid2 domain-containing protein n=1 Tax=Aplosporella prunicola CBS 121167 TaxID=1176127 RepID=A0A6A6BEH5_9PEZI|nr:uncharacterized protein K452DRAFT_19310 [Aplosporella prunicola CBS 121167]KAF2142466.1 hypothetical protein K452DRAFT_19310 [Aplosporella prunicola CBS 121167]